jgi:hypothetical protein
MFDFSTETLTPAGVRLVSEALERLTAAGILRVEVPLGEAAAALAVELRSMQLMPTRDVATAILALRAAGWPLAGAQDPVTRGRVTEVAFTVAGMLASESPRHVADFLRHAEEEISGRERRSLDAVLPEATRAIEVFRELVADPPGA